jgi:uncharacterized protein
MDELLLGVKTLDERISAVNKRLCHPHDAVVSKFNFVYRSDTGQIFVYNILYGTIATVSTEGAAVLAGKSIEGITDTQFERLKKFMFIVPGELDELGFYSEQYKIMQFESESVPVVYCPTYTCDFECLQCFQDPGLKDLKVQPDAAAIIRRHICSLLEERHARLFDLAWMGGEPLLRFKWVVDESRYFKEWCVSRGIGFQCQIFTNGAIISERILDSFSGINIDAWQITIDGNREIHNARHPLLNKSGSCYDLIIAGMKRLLDRKQNIVLRIAVNREMMNDISGLLNDLEKAGLKNRLGRMYFYAMPMTGGTCQEHDAKQDYMSTNMEFTTLQDELMDLTIQKGFTVGFEEPAPRYVHCGAFLDRGIAVDGNLNLYKCAIHLGHPGLAIGKIGKDGIYDRNASIENNYMCRDPWLLEPCSSCGLLPGCGGGCVGKARKDSNGNVLSNCRGVSEKKLRQKILCYLEQKTSVRNLEPMIIPCCQNKPAQTFLR